MKLYHVGRERELIDTCWDVNNEIIESDFAIVKELIDTCWDVNLQ